ncbi:MAG: hypothetical protein AAF580_12725 [Pseudomonadota bacterium]
MSEPFDRVMVAWLALASVAFSLALACAAPFAGLAATAALFLSPRHAVAAALAGWVANQAVGYGLLGYPMDAESFAWGAVLGVSAVVAALAALCAMRMAPAVVAPAVAFVAAFALQQATVLAATAILPSHPDAFALSVIAALFATNALAFAVLAGSVFVAQRARLVWRQPRRG